MLYVIYHCIVYVYKVENRVKNKLSPGNKLIQLKA